MSEHLPECLTPMYDAKAWCICDELRACEERAEAGAYNAGYVDGSKDAREGAFYEAREAVAKECSTYPDLCGQCRANVYAIEALMEGTE